MSEETSSTQILYTTHYTLFQGETDHYISKLQRQTAPTLEAIIGRPHPHRTQEKYPSYDIQYKIQMLIFN